MASFSQGNLVVGRVVNEDDDFMLIEIPKSDEHTFHLDDDVEQNRFYTMLFCSFKDGEPTFVKPWEKTD